MNNQIIQKAKNFLSSFNSNYKLSFSPSLLLFFLAGMPSISFGQVIVQGYVFESGNRGYVETAAITVVENGTKVLKGNAETDVNGKFEIALAPGKDYLIRIHKKPFEPIEKLVSLTGKSDGEKVFEKFEMSRMPGYVFEVTLAPTRSDEDVVVDAITGAWIEVYNNTIDKEELNLKNHPSHTFSCRFEQGNHYTVLIRKDGFYNKRLEAYVNVKGCILCFDGVGEVKPGVSEVLTEGFEMGTLLANVELQPIRMNEEIEINNIYYDSGSAKLKAGAKEELDKLIILLNDNQNLLVEIGSHTDSKGDAKMNQQLSLKRAESVIEYLVSKGIKKQRFSARGYGESKLRNRCADGVECSEIKHQKNRRTELKVLGYVHSDYVDNQSLAEKKEVEKLEKLMAELQNSEIKIGEGESLPEDLKQQLEKQASGKENKVENKAEKEAAKSNVEESPFVEKYKPVTKEKVAMDTVLLETTTGRPIELRMTKKPGDNKIKKPQLATVEEDEKVAPNNRNTINKVSTIEPLRKEEEKLPVVEDTGITFEEEDFNDTAEYDENPSSVKMAVNQEVTRRTFIKAPKKLPNDYTGFKVQIMASAYELPLNHEVFATHGNIMLEETKQGTFAYLLGDFSDEAIATDFMNNIIAKRYSNARVVEYLEGRRVVE